MKMLREERELRGWIRASCKAERIRDYHVLNLVTAFRRAVIEEALQRAEIAGNDVWCELVRDKIWGVAQGAAVTQCREAIAAAIRKGGK